MLAEDFARWVSGGVYVTHAETGVSQLISRHSTTSRDRPERAALACDPWWSEAPHACAAVLLVAGMLALTHLLARPLRCDWGCEDHDAWCARENGHAGDCACADSTCQVSTSHES